MKLTVDQKAGLFRTCATKSFYDVGIEFGFDKHYKTNAGIKNAAYKVYKEVLEAPEAFGVHPDTQTLVREAVANRSVAVSPKKTVSEQKDGLTLTQYVEENRNIASRLIHKKLTQLDNSKSALRGESLVTLGKIFGILFDKGQILAGQATEHIAVMGNIDSNMSPDQALDMVLKMREVTNKGDKGE